LQDGLEGRARKETGGVRETQRQTWKGHLWGHQEAGGNLRRTTSLALCSPPGDDVVNPMSGGSGGRSEMFRK